jgi:hypothetical protein
MNVVALTVTGNQRGAKVIAGVGEYIFQCLVVPIGKYASRYLVTKTK